MMLIQVSYALFWKRKIFQASLRKMQKLSDKQQQKASTKIKLQVECLPLFVPDTARESALPSLPILPPYL